MIWCIYAGFGASDRPYYLAEIGDDPASRLPDLVAHVYLAVVHAPVDGIEDLTHVGNSPVRAGVVLVEMHRAGDDQEAARTEQAGKFAREHRWLVHPVEDVRARHDVEVAFGPRYVRRG